MELPSPKFCQPALPRQIVEKPEATMPDVLPLFVDRMDTPIGELLLVVDDGRKLRALDWADYEERMLRLLRLHYGKAGGKAGFRLEPAHQAHGLKEAIGRYFAGDIGAIDEIPVETAGTAFQRSVWNELRRIPKGSAISYGKLAEQIGRPKAVRAAGLANGANPVGIVVPCHRVIGSNGSLTGYGGGLERKRWLLEHERKHTAYSGKSMSSQNLQLSRFAGGAKKQTTFTNGT